MRPRETSGPALGGSLPRWPQGGGVAMATASPAADWGRGRPWEGGLVSWPPAPPLTLPWTWMGPSWGQHPGHWGFPALTEPSASPATSLGIFEVRRVLDASGCSMLAPLQTGAARFSSYLLSRARKVLGSHLFSPCGVPEFCSISTRKLAAHGFGASMAAMVSFPPQRYHYFLVLDFEATCDKPQIQPQEIIEFPILKLNGRTMEIESTFHMYVQPVIHPQLTPFCTELTGIIQAMVDGQPSLQQVLERVDEWMAKEGLLDPNVKSIFVTCGDWDLKVMLQQVYHLSEACGWNCNLQPSQRMGASVGQSGLRGRQCVLSGLWAGREE
ncbi:ERI1 exoribonuclease 3 isoform X3 [Artibeus jamaicensis]|uniref:ERI1 exoribonuclease 3 isoform X3 n=1 Tax=Artibeus jamaicensis TaxID=9417 RepID=UPI00235A9118|nr:ERI1 exoribonuclease 3 isoform X3 [Artibeus jamaicensis]